MKQSDSSGIHKRLLRGSGAQIASQVTQILIRFTEVPLLLYFWGIQLYGEWLMLSAIPVYFIVCDCGFSTAACHEMTLRGGAGDKEGVITLFQSTWLIVLVFSALTLITVLVLIKVIPLKDWLAFKSMNKAEINITFFLLIVHVMVVLQSGVLNGGFWVSGSYPASMYFIVFTQLLEFIGFAASIVLGGGPVQATSAYLAGRILGTFIMWMGQRKVTPWLHFGFQHASFSEIRRIAYPALGSIAFPLGEALNIQGLRLILGLVIEPAALALFVPTRTLSRIVMQPGLIISRLIKPELALSYGSKNNSLIQKIFKKANQLTFWGSLAACFIVGFGAFVIFPFWTVGTISVHYPTLIILLLVGLVHSIWYTSLMLPYAINLHCRIALHYILIYGFTNCCLVIILAKQIGITGAALSLLLTEFAIFYFVLKESLSLAKISLRNWASDIITLPFKKIRI